MQLQKNVEFILNLRFTFLAWKSQRSEKWEDSKKAYSMIIREWSKIYLSQAPASHRFSPSSQTQGPTSGLDHRWPGAWTVKLRALKGTFGVLTREKQICLEWRVSIHNLFMLRMACFSFATAFSPGFLLEKLDIKTITFKKHGNFED